MPKQFTRGRKPAGSGADPPHSVRIAPEVWEKLTRRATYEGITASYVLAALAEGYGDGVLDLPKIVVSYNQPREAVG